MELGSNLTAPIVGLPQAFLLGNRPYLAQQDRRTKDAKSAVANHGCRDARSCSAATHHDLSAGRSDLLNRRVPAFSDRHVQSGIAVFPYCMR